MDDLLSHAADLHTTATVRQRTSGGSQGTSGGRLGIAGVSTGMIVMMRLSDDYPMLLIPKTAQISAVGAK